MRNWVDLVVSVAYILMMPLKDMAEHCSKLQPSINLHAPVTAFMFGCSGDDVLPPRREQSSGYKPCEWSSLIDTNSGLEPERRDSKSEAS